MRTNLFLLSAAAAASVAPAVANAGQNDNKPNIILIMVDDMGYSDIGCFGSEIPTPNIDRLAANGVRYTQIYNTGRSCPTRASLLTGLYPHQSGIGEMSEDPFNRNARSHSPFNRGIAGYLGFLNRHCVTMAEVLGEAGYNTYMVGKWHVGMDGKDKWPLQRGFDRFYGILSGACSYLEPQGDRGLTLDNTKLPAPAQPYYTTDAFTDYALQFMESNPADKPFFLYVAYNAPHWPLHAKDEDIAKFEGKYEKGWEKIRNARYKKMRKLGITDADWDLAEWESRGWNELSKEERSNSAKRMSVYAAQVYSMDYNVGRITEYLKEKGELENTLIIFLSDNGACAEPYSETGFGTIADINKKTSWVEPSYGLPWSQVSNTPFRKYKVRAYEGGISTPLILSWPEKYSQYDGQIRTNVGFLPDIMSTFIDAADATYPKTYHGGNYIIPAEGGSLLPAIENPEATIHEYIFGEHYNNCYVRWGKWKAVKDEKSDQWELYDIEKDRSETTDMAGSNPELLKQLTDKWQLWAYTHNVFPKNKD